jgi:hypothetical protein
MRWQNISFPAWMFHIMYDLEGLDLGGSRCLHRRRPWLALVHEDPIVMCGMMQVCSHPPHLPAIHYFGKLTIWFLDIIDRCVSASLPTSDWPITHGHALQQLTVQAQVNASLLVFFTMHATSVLCLLLFVLLNKNCVNWSCVQLNWVVWSKIESKLS